MGTDVELVHQGAVVWERCPANIDLLRKWSVDDLKRWLFEAVPIMLDMQRLTAEVRDRCGLALRVCREQMGDGDYGEYLKEAAKAVHRQPSTLDRWRHDAELAHQLAPVSKRSATRQAQENEKRTTAHVSGEPTPKALSRNGSALTPAGPAPAPVLPIEPKTPAPISAEPERPLTVDALLANKDRVSEVVSKLSVMADGALSRCCTEEQLRRATERFREEWKRKHGGDPEPQSATTPRPKAPLRRKTPARPAKAEPCLHPVGRRIGDGCGACGQKVAKTR